MICPPDHIHGRLRRAHIEQHPLPAMSRRSPSELAFNIGTVPISRVAASALLRYFLHPILGGETGHLD